MSEEAMADRLHLSPPDVSSRDRAALEAAFDSGWIAPLGPDVEAFERDLALATGRAYAAALSSGTAALHLSLIVGGVERNDIVYVSDLTFAATANAVRYVGARPVFIDSDRETWNMDPDLLEQALEDDRRAGLPAAAVIAVDVYGQCAALDRIRDICREYEMLLIEDAAEALGATLHNQPAGSFGEMAVLSFNGNKIITTSGGGALVSDRAELVQKAVYLSTQARDPAPHYQHSEVGYNYRLSNLLAGLGRSQLSDLTRRVDIRRGHNQAYREVLSAIPGVEFMPEIVGGRSSFWLTALTFDEDQTGVAPETVRNHLDAAGIESRPVWKPMHLQPVFSECKVVGGHISADLFRRGLCLPSGSQMSEAERSRVSETILGLHREAVR